MKEFLFNSDGTIKIKNMVIVVDLVVLAFLLGILYLLFNGRSVDTFKKTTTTQKIETTTIILCQDCSLSFNRKTLSAEPNKTYFLEDLLDLEKVSIYNVKFKLSDDKYGVIKSVNGKAALVTNDYIGSYTLTAEYENKKDTLNIVCNSTGVVYDFEKHAYYVHKDEDIDLNIISTPEGADTSNADIRVDNENIASINNKRVHAKEVGDTSLMAVSEYQIKYANLYVVNKMMTIKVKENSIYEEVDEIKYDKLKPNFDILLIVEGEDEVNPDDIKVDVVNSGDINPEVTFESKSSTVDNGFIYRININVKYDEITGMNYSKIVFTLNDGSKRQLIINR